jgi:hypothetical protein
MGAINSSPSLGRNQGHTFIAYTEVERLERIRAGAALAWGCPRIEEARETRSNFPNHHNALLQRCGYQPMPIRREAASCDPAFVAFEDIKASCGLEVVEDDSAFIGPYGETLTGRMKVDGRISVTV